MINDIAILDFGTSKIKVLTCKFTNKNDILTELEFYSVSIGRLLSANDITNEGKTKTLQDFESKTISIIQDLLKDGYKIKTIATEVFRKNEELKIILKQITQKYNIFVEILTPSKEAEFLAANFDLKKTDLLLDIGGGSVNAIYKIDNKIKNNCYSIGAYVLHNLFQAKNEIFNDKSCLDINSYIKNFMSSFTTIYKNNFNKIILGSNQMLSFFNSLSKKTGLNFMKEKSFDSIVINDIINNIFLNRKYEDLFQYFDKNPNFMYGADKMLLILKNFVELTDAKIIFPTDDGISSGFAKICLKNN